MMRVCVLLFGVVILHAELVNVLLAREVSANVSSITLKERVSAQRSIEDVYWRHRTWPGESKKQKSRPSTIMSEQAIREKVDDYLRKSNALEIFWKQPVDRHQIQAEMDRIVRNTKQPEVLLEVFAALGNNPDLIAECIVRPVLVDRRIRSLYAADSRLHAVVRDQAEQQLALATMTDKLRILPGYQEITWKKQSQLRSDTSDFATLDSEEWDDLLRMFAQTLSPQDFEEVPFPRMAVDSDRIPIGTVSALQENEASYFAISVLDRSEESIRVATVVWPKTGFDEWWNLNKSSVGVVLAVPANGSSYSLDPSSVLTASVPCADDSWTPTVFVEPEARYDHTAVWTGTEMIVWGGVSYLGRENTGGRYNPTFDSWTPTNVTGAPTGRVGHTAIWTGSKMIVWGGYVGISTQTGGIYDPVANSWTSTRTIGAPGSRTQHTAVWTDSEMIIWGGFAGGYTNTGGRYNPSTDTWIPTDVATAPTPRTGYNAVWTGTEMVIWGGSDGSLVFTNTGGRYNPTSDSWAPTSLIDAPSSRASAEAVWTGAEMIIWGGIEDSTVDNIRINTGGRYNPSSDSWVATTIVGAPAPRSQHTVVWTGSEMIVWGGVLESPIGATSSGGRYDPISDSWIPTSLSNAPLVRAHHTAVWTGSEMIVWGGEKSVGSIGPYTSTGGRYDPVTDGWSPTMTSGAPLGGHLHTAVWTGIEMVIWGGESPFGFENTGGRYYPSLDSWIPTTQTEAPSPRAAHTAVWTGLEMIVWGGHGGGSTGARYDPAGDSWVPVTEVGAPEGYSDHTAIWTGEEMIVWGGQYGPEPTNTGGRYDPDSDTWIPTSISNAPSARLENTAVWTGTEMIIWGGVNTGPPYGALNTGGRYNPGTDTWQATDTEGAPTGLYSFTAVWAETQMIVWGGYGGNGSRYFPETDSWIPTAQVDVPPGLDRYSAVWTGIEMIVWGGYGGNGSTSQGMRYDPYVDTWTSTTINGAPTHRSGHTAVWTGDWMIIWGGEPKVYSGGLYCASRPGARNDTYTVAEDTQLAVVVPGVLANDVDLQNDPLAAALLEGPAFGTVALASDGSFFYTPEADYNGVDSFTYKASDGPADSTGATVFITVNPVNDQPQAIDDYVTVDEDTVLNIGSPGVLDNDSDRDGDQLSAFLVSEPRNGSIVFKADGSLVFTPNVNFNGTTSFTYRTTDGSLSSNLANVFIVVSPVNDPPVAVEDRFSVDEDSPLNVRAPGLLANDMDAEHDVLKAEIVSEPAHGTILLNANGSFSFTAAQDYYGLDSFSYKVSDGDATSAPVFVAIEVNPVNDPPEAEADGVDVIANSTATIPVLGNDFDRDGDSLLIVSVTQGVHGTASIIGSVVSYTPYDAYIGPDTFMYTISDDHGGFDTTGVSVSVLNGPVMIGIDDVSVDEPADGSVIAVFTVSLSRESDEDVSVDFVSMAGSALPGDDYVSASGQLIIPAGSTFATITIEVLADDQDPEDEETCTIALSNAANAIIEDDQGILMIRSACLFCDDFENGELATSWTYSGTGWIESGGFLAGTSNKGKAVAVAKPAFPGCNVCTVRTILQTAGGLGNRVWLLAWYVDRRNTIEVLMNDEKDSWLLKHRVDGSVVAKVKGLHQIIPDVPYEVKVAFDGAEFSLLVDGLEIARLMPSSPVAGGTVGFKVKSTTASFSLISVK